MKTYKKGDDFQENKDDYKTYGITEVDPNSTFFVREHAQKIEIYGDWRLRNRIIKLLNKYEKEKSK